MTRNCDASHYCSRQHVSGLPHELVHPFVAPRTGLCLGASLICHVLHQSHDMVIQPALVAALLTFAQVTRKAKHLTKGDIFAAYLLFWSLLLLLALYYEVKSGTERRL